MALLEIMRELTAHRSVHIHCAHVHHMLRPDEADADQAFVRTYARLVGVACTAVRVNVPRRRKTHHESPEEAARALRYEALERIRRRTGMDVIATAHHADDQTETVIMRAMRGTDVRGLAGILPRLAVPPVIRPLLEIPRRTLQSYLAEGRIPYRHDTSNADVRLTRNRIRIEIIPRLMATHDRSMASAVPALATAARRFGASLGSMLPLLLASRTGTHHGEHLVGVEAIRALPPGVRRSYIGMLLSIIGVGLTTDRIMAVERLLTMKPGKRLEFRSSGVSVLRDRAHLVFGHQSGHSHPDVRLRPGGRATVEGGVIRATKPRRPPTRFERDQSIAWVDAALLQNGLRVRRWRAGDRFQPLGMGGQSKKVSDFLRDEHIPLYYRDSVPVVTHRGTIVWVCGLRPDERFRITPATKRAIQLSFHLSV